MKTRFEQCATCEYSTIYWVCGHVDNVVDDGIWCPGPYYITWECEIEELTPFDVILNIICHKWRRRNEDSEI